MPSLSRVLVVAALLFALFVALRPIAGAALRAHGFRLRGVSMFAILEVLPPHGWRALWWELGVVTLGVLIALAAQQVVETLHERWVALETRAAVQPDSTTI